MGRRERDRLMLFAAWPSLSPLPRPLRLAACGGRKLGICRRLVPPALKPPAELFDARFLLFSHLLPLPLPASEKGAGTGRTSLGAASREDVSQGGDRLAHFQLIWGNPPSSSRLRWSSAPWRARRRPTCSPRAPPRSPGRRLSRCPGTRGSPRTVRRCREPA